MSLTKVTNAMQNSAPASVKDFGATGDGTTDDTAAIQSALDSGYSPILFPQGVYRTTDTIYIDNVKIVEGSGNNLSSLSTQIKPDSDVLVGVMVGYNTIFGGTIKNIEIVRDSYDGTTENIGWLFVDCAGSYFENLNGRYNKYNIKFEPSTGNRVAYNSFMNCGGVGGYYNLWIEQDDTGWSNENTFYGGRMFTTSDTDTNIYQATGNHNRYVNVSAEGGGTQAILIEGSGTHSNVIENVRVEGTWSVDDIVIGSGVQNTTIFQNNLYSTVTDNGSGTIYFTRTGVQFNGVLNGYPIMKVGSSSTSDGTLFQVRSNRFTAANLPIEVVRASDDLHMFSVDGFGRAKTRTGFTTETSSWNFNPLQLGSYTLWVDATGDLRIINGTPSSDTDGTVVGTQS